MIRLLFIILLALSLSACNLTAAKPPAPRAKSLADASPAPSAERRLPADRADSLMNLIAKLYPDYPYNGEGRPTIEISVEKIDGKYQATIIEDGFSDDAVAATKDVLIVSENSGEWVVVSKHSWQKCYRTGIFDWTTKSCP